MIFPYLRLFYQRVTIPLCFKTVSDFDRTATSKSGRSRSIFNIWTCLAAICFSFTASFSPCWFLDPWLNKKKNTLLFGMKYVVNHGSSWFSFIFWSNNNIEKRENTPKLKHQAPVTDFNGQGVHATQAHQG